MQGITGNTVCPAARVPHLHLAVPAFCVFCVVTGADVVTTLVILGAGGHELNIFLAPVINLILPIKVGAVMVIGSLAAVCERRLPGAGWKVITAAVAVTVLPVIHNLMVIFEV